ncbi:ABC transporter substrate-binding protein [Amphritea sp. 2_MG-2023]|uniref:MlaC/ttg2D family ABC transporter substrate-binding protein n=1 Tax=Amphritea TaxID=515417 RepID=UPI0020904C93|nr:MULTISPECIES: ABC transporter substrate-binding protein [Amphritea]MDO6418231.1 ABC transporter substrate-binding protein [Amphritea sp. 2_MG-2023]MDX2422753.1 ABC transporter substrate-binding protein [Amphritea sp.]
MKYINRWLVLLTILFASVSAQASWEEARDTIEQASSQMMAVLEKPSLKAPEKSEELIADIEAILNPVVDFSYVSKRVMGKYYNRVDEKQQSLFSTVFKDTMVRTFAKSLTGFDIVRYEVAEEGHPSPAADKQVVSVYVYSADGKQYTLVYYMLKQDDGWKLVNVLVDGINLRLNFKNQFADMASRTNGNVKQVIADWKDAIASNGSKES